LRGLALRDIGALRGKLITSFYGYDVSEFIRRHGQNSYARLLSRADLSLAISAVMRQKLVELGAEAGRTRVHRLGVNPNLFSPSRRATGDRPLRIITIGRMVAKKGMEYGLRAVAAVASEVPGIEYTIFGDGPLRGQIEQIVAELGLQGLVRLAGWKSRADIVSAIHEADILLAPSVTPVSGDQEGTPVVIMEAMASGLPVVSTLHAGIPEVVEDGASGFLVAERDVSGLAGALKQLAGSRDLRAAMGGRGRSIITERHDIEKLNDTLFEIYGELAGRSSI
jgi:colanic acid/amylovoran biosynthesis glycosyltransferase